MPFPLRLSLRRRELGRRAHFQRTVALAFCACGLLALAGIGLCVEAARKGDQLQAYLAWLVFTGFLLVLLAGFAQVQAAMDRALSRSER